MEATSAGSAGVAEAFSARLVVGWMGLFIAAGSAVAGLACWPHHPDLARRTQGGSPPAYDGVTGLPTRRLFLVLLKQALSRAQTTKRHVAVLVCALDQFRPLATASAVPNRTLAVRVQAARIKSALQPHDVVARLDEHTFAVITDNLESPDQANVIAKKIQSTMSLALLIEGQEVLLSCRIGGAGVPEDGSDAETLLETALQSLSNRHMSNQSMAVVSAVTTPTSSLSSLTYAGGLRQ